MTDFDELSCEEFSGKARLFPLPKLVLFPHVMQPLHIFEQRYRDLLEDALAGDGLIALASLAPGWESNYEGRPSLYSMACLGRVTTHYQLADGTYNVLLLGLRRAKLVRELAPKRHFREARVELCTDVYADCSTSRRRVLQRQLTESLLCMLPTLPEAREQLDHLLGDDVPLGVLTDVVGYLLNIGIEQKQALLAEVNVCRRAKMLLAHLSEAVALLAAGSADAVRFPPAFSCN